MPQQELKNFQDYSELGKNLLIKGKYEEAEKTYAQAIEIKSDDAWSNCNLGRALLHQGKIEEAISYLQKSIELNPKIAEIYCYLGDALAKQNRFTEAVHSYRKAIDLQPDKFLYYHNIGDSLLLQGNYEEAIDSYQQAIKLNPTYVWSYYNWGNALANLSRWEEATTIYLKALKQISGFSELVSKLAIAQSRISSDRITAEPSFSFLSKLKDLFGDDISRETQNGELVASAPSAEQEIFPELDDDSFLARMFEMLLGRSAAESEISLFIELFKKGNLSRVSALENILKSEEFAAKNQANALRGNDFFAEKSDKEFIDYVYRTFLKRPPDPQGLAGNLQALANGASRSAVLEAILKCEEFLGISQQSILENLSDYDFLHIIWEILLGRYCDLNAERYHLALFDSGVSRSDFVLGVMKTDEFKQRANNFHISGESKSSEKIGTTNSALIMGTDRFINQDEWNDLLLQVLLEQASNNDDEEQNSLHLSQQSSFQKSKQLPKEFATIEAPLVSIITSLYKGGKYIHHFMKNITSQTIFEVCELIIIDANSPEREYEVIEKYMEKFGNIKYMRTDEVIDIYEAWNLGVKKSKGRFLTNANLDDLRSADCLEKQAMALLKNEDFDLVYQDVYYTFTPNLPFELIAKCNVKSKLPMVTKANMLQFNSPHNAPMWRKSLHDKVGLFNTRYKSAGDYELWLRAMLNGSKFMKIEEALVAYYNNPFGISTRSETNGVKEAIEIQRVYVRLFGNNFFSMSKEDFINFCYSSFGMSEDLKQVQSSEMWVDKESFLYQCFNRRFKELSESSKYYVNLGIANNEPPNIDANGSLASAAHILLQ